MKKILVLGNFAYHKNALNGQSMRTRTVKDSITKYAIGYQTVYIDTSDKKILTFLMAIYHLLTSAKIVVLTGKKGLKPILFFIHYMNLSEKTVYVVIGGWLAQYIAENKKILNKLKGLKSLLVQTQTLKSNLNDLGLNKVKYFPNYRISNSDNNKMTGNKDLLRKVVFYSRVCKDKGTDMAIEAIGRINARSDEPISLDIYGPILAEYEQEFKDHLSQYENIQYLGALENEAIIPALSQYDCMIFPTHYEGEGFPGAVLEALIAGVPVIASDWKYNREIIQDHKTGLLFETYSIDDLIEKITYIQLNPHLISKMSDNCMIDAEQYHESKVLPILFESMELEITEKL